MEPQFLDKSEKKAIYKLLARAEFREIAYLDATLRTAYLAAFQLIDKRIEIIETQKNNPKKTGVDFSLGDVVFDVFLDLVINGVAGKLIEAGMEKLIRPMVRSRQAYYAIPKIKIKKKKIKITGVRLDEGQLKAARKKAKKKLQEHFNRIANSEDFTAFESVAKALGDSALAIGGDTAREALNLPTSVQKLADSSASKGLTPVVEILLATLNGYNLQKNAVETLYSDLNAELQYSDITAVVGAEWRSFLEENMALGFTTKSELDAFHRPMIRWYEMSMWAYLFDFEALTISESGGTVYGPRITSDQDVAVRERLSDSRNYKIHDKSEKAVTYQIPKFLPRSEGGYANAYKVQNQKVTISISEDILNYWIKNFPFRTYEPNGPTIFEVYDKHFGFSKGKQDRIDRTLIKSYDRALSNLSAIRRDIKAGKRMLERR